MSEDKKITTLINAELPDSVDNALKNLTDKPTQNIGQTFSDVWYLVFGGISQAADKRRMRYSQELKQYQQELEQAIDTIPEGKKVEPSIQVTAQALENSKYCISSESLRKMFTNLISGTMNRDVEPYVHPSFPEIIKQMSPLDADILKTFSKTSTQPIVNYVFKKAAGGTHPLSSYLFFKNDRSFSLSYSDSISSLERLGLLSVTFASHLTKDSLYEPFRDLPYFEHVKNFYKTSFGDGIFDMEKGICSLTPLGRSFIHVCISQS